MHLSEIYTKIVGIKKQIDRNRNFEIKYFRQKIFLNQKRSFNKKTFLKKITTKSNFDKKNSEKKFKTKKGDQKYF